MLILNQFGFFIFNLRVIYFIIAIFEDFPLKTMFRWTILYLIHVFICEILIILHNLWIYLSNLMILTLFLCSNFLYIQNCAYNEPIIHTVSLIILQIP